MASVFELPAVGDTMVEAEIVEWLVAVGDEVGLDQPICSIETDKSVVEMTTPYRGTVLALGGEPGDVIAVGQPLIVVGAPGEEVPTGPDTTAERDATAAGPTTAAEPDIAADRGPATAEGVGGVGLGGLAAESTAGSGTSAVPDAAAEAAADRGLTAAPGGASSPKAMPKVRRMARERSVDLAAVAGSGPGGSITAADLEAAAGPGGERRERLSGMRRSIARHLTESVRTIPQFTAMVEADAAGLLAARSAAAEAGSPVPLDAVLTSLVVPALKDHPVMNARLDGDDIVYYDRYDIGVAVDAPDGLMVPVVRGADRLSTPELGAEIRRLAAAARDRTIEPAELAGATATVNNVGAVGIIAGTPILPTSTSMIAAFGRSRPVVRMRASRPEEAPVITVCATFDHRIIDGGSAGRFLAELKDRIEAVGAEGLEPPTPSL